MVEYTNDLYNKKGQLKVNCISIKKTHILTYMFSL